MVHGPAKDESMMRFIATVCINTAVLSHPSALIARLPRLRNDQGSPGTQRRLKANLHNVADRYRNVQQHSADGRIWMPRAPYSMDTKPSLLCTGPERTDFTLSPSPHPPPSWTPSQTNESQDFHLVVQELSTAAYASTIFLKASTRRDRQVKDKQINKQTQVEASTHLEAGEKKAAHP